MAQKRRKLGEILKQWGKITDEQLAEALKVGTASKKKIGEVLVEMSFCSDADVAQALASQAELEYIDVDQPDAINKDALGLIPYELIKKYWVLPLGKEDGKLKILVHDPLDLDVLDKLRFRLNCDISIALGSQRRIKEFVERWRNETKASIDQAVREMTVDKTGRTTDGSMDIRPGQTMDIKGLSLDGSKDRSIDSSIDSSIDRGSSVDIAARAEKEAAEQAPIVKLVNQIIGEAVIMRASDIHIEPFANRVRLRYRIDGVCVERDTIPKRTQGSVIARLKLIAGVKIEEKRIPQSGRIKLGVQGAKIDFRFEVCPGYHGETVVMRILRPDSARMTLEALGLRSDVMDVFNKVIRRPNGIFLVTGPTGSGKTTTLYAALNVLNRPDRKIITAEDPVEYNFKGINQCQVNEHIGLTFSKVLRAMLRQAPNIVLVGEIRDKEVADVAIQAALTGHLVFSTLHTNDAPSAITRLIDMGVKPFLVASSIQAVLGQRLIRVLCPECKQPDPEPNMKMLRIVDIRPQDLVGKTLFKPGGCPKCSNTGYKGRRGVYEMMTMNAELRDLAFKRAPVNALRQAAVASGMRNLLGDGKLRVLEGVTTAEEISRIAQVEGVVETDEEEAASAAEATSA